MPVVLAAIPQPVLWMFCSLLGLTGGAPGLVIRETLPILPQHWAMHQLVAVLSRNAVGRALVLISTSSTCLPCDVIRLGPRCRFHSILWF
jgi:hypothetical protein